MRFSGDGFRRGLDTAQRGVVTLVRRTQNREVSFLPGLDAHHVGFRNLRFHGDGVEQGQLDDGGRALVGIDRLPQLRDDGHHHASHGRHDAGVADIELGRISGNSRLRNLRLRGFDIRAAGAQRGLGLLKSLARNCVGGQQLFLPLKVQLGLTQQSTAGTEQRLGTLQRSLRIAQLVLLLERVNLGNQLSFFDGVAQRHGQGLDLPRGLRTHTDLLESLQGAGGQHRLLQVTQRRRGRDKSRRLAGRKKVELDAHARPGQQQGGQHINPHSGEFGKTESAHGHAFWLVWRANPDFTRRLGRAPKEVGK